MDDFCSFYVDEQSYEILISNISKLLSARERNTRRPGGRPEWVAVQYLVLPGLGWDRIHPGGKLQDGGGCERTAQGDEDGPGRGTEERRRSSLVPPRATEGAWRSVEEKAQAPRKCEPGVWVIKSNTFSIHRK